MTATTFDMLMGEERTFSNPLIRNLYEENRQTYQDLVEKVRCNTVLPLVGAGFSAAAYPTWTNLLREMAEPYPVCSQKVQAALDAGAYGQLEEAASMLCDEMTRNAFIRHIDQTFGVGTLEKSLLKITEDRRLLPKIFQGNVLTTNFDQIIEELYGRRLNVICPHTRYQQPAVERAAQGNAPVLIKLHGDVADRTHIIITKEDYDERYGADACKSQKPLVKTLKKLLASRPVLFLGCSLGSDRILQVLAACAGEDREYFALVELPKETKNPDDPFSPLLLSPDGDENAEYRSRRRFLGKHHIRCIWYPHGMYDAMDALLRRLYMDLHPAPAARRASKDPPVSPVRDIIGREKEMDELCRMLLEEKKPIFVTGTGGMGKTETCRGAAGRFCQRQTDFSFKEIALFGVKTAETLCGAVAETLGISPLQNVGGLDHYLAYLETEIQNNGFPGKYGLYFDNWEDLWYGLSGEEEQRVKVLNWLRLLAEGGVPVLVSSRETPRKYDVSICFYPLPVLDRSKQYDRQLFEKIYREKGGRLSLTGEMFEALLDKLDGHPLSIVLVATQASRKADWQAVLKDWTAAEKEGVNPRHNRLDTALRVSWNEVCANSACADVWGIMALSLEELPLEWMLRLADGEEEQGRWEEALAQMHDASLIDWSADGMLHMIPPVKETFFLLAQEEQIAESFKRWTDYFLELCGRTALAHPDRPRAHVQLLEQLPQALHVLSRLLDKPDFLAMAGALARGLRNYYQFQAEMSVGVLEQMVSCTRGEGLAGLHAFACRCAGDLQGLLGNPDGAGKLYEAAERLYCKEQDDLGLAHVLKSRGDLQGRLGNLDSAGKLYEAAEGLYRKECDDLGLANVLQSRGDLQVRLGNPDGAGKLYEAAEGLYRKERNDLGLANVLQSRGNLQRRLGNLDGAEKLYEAAEGLYRKERDDLGMANVLQSRGDLQGRLGDPDGAGKLYEAAEGLYRKERDDLGLANALKSRGDLQGRLGNLDAAGKLYEAAEGLYRKERNNLGLANVLKSRGDLQGRLGDPDGAGKLYEAAEGLYRKVRDDLGLANVLKSRGDLQGRLGDLDGAGKLYEAAEGLYRKERADLGLANVLQSRGDLQVRLGDLDDVGKLYEVAEGLYRKERDDLGLANVLQSRGDLYQQAGRLEDALHAYGRALPLYKSERNVLGETLTLAKLCYVHSLNGNSREVRKLAEAIGARLEDFPYESAEVPIRGLRNASLKNIRGFKRLIYAIRRRACAVANFLRGTGAGQRAGRDGGQGIA